MCYRRVVRTVAWLRWRAKALEFAVRVTDILNVSHGGDTSVSTKETENGNHGATNTPPQAKPVRLGWGIPHHHVGMNLPSHPTNEAPNPAAHAPTHTSPQKGAAKPLVEYRSDASNTDDEYYDFAEGGFY